MSLTAKVRAVFILRVQHFGLQDHHPKEHQKNIQSVIFVKCPLLCFAFAISDHVIISGETTQKMRSASYPTPAELDAYAKKIANTPLTIQIYPNSVKVPQRKHIRRTVNGLDTSLSSQRHSPYSTLVSSSRGLLAVFRAPVKGVIKELDGSHTRRFHKAIMNPQSRIYATQSTLNLPQPALHLQSPAQPVAQVSQKQNLVQPRTIQQQQSLSQPMTLQQPQHMPNSQPLQQMSVPRSEAQKQEQTMMQVQTSQQQRLTHRQGIRSLPHTQALQQQQNQPCPPVRPQQHLYHVQTSKSQSAGEQVLFTQQGVPQDLHHIPDGAPLLNLQRTEDLVVSQPPPQAAGAPPDMANGLQPPHTGAYGPRKLPDADAPPNVTVSTSTIPLSMASSLHQNRPGDLSSIVHQINQLCQARAGMGSTSVCEGQIANPSPISRNLLINASSRVSSHHSARGSVPNCLMVGPSDNATAQASNASLHSEPSLTATKGIPTFQTESETVHLQQQQQQIQQHLHRQQQHLQLQQLQLQQQQQHSWAQHQLALMQQPPEGARPCKNPRIEPSAECAFPSQNLSYSNKLPNTAQSFSLKHPAEKTRPSSPVTCPVGSMPYTNGPYMHPLWGNIPATASGSGSGPQDLPVAFQRGQVASSAEIIQGAKYLPGKDCTSQSKMMQKVDFFGRPIQVPSFQDQNVDVMEKFQGAAVGQVQTPNNGRGVHTHHPDFC